MNLEKELEKTIEPLRTLVAETVETIFQKPVQLLENWKFTSRFSNPCDLACVMSASNAQFVILLATGFNFKTAKAILGENENEAFYLDALGELANSICGQLIKVPQIVNDFGIFLQAPPLLMNAGSKISFPKAQGVNGTLLADGHEVWVGFSLREK